MMLAALSQEALLSVPKCAGKGLDIAARPTTSSALVLVLDPKRPARTPADAAPLEMPRGSSMMSKNSSSSGPSEQGERFGSHMPNEEEEK